MQSHRSRFSRRPQPLLRDRRGTVLILSAIAMPVCVGVMALGIDVSYWEVQRIQLQHIADVAALAGAVRYSQTSSATAAVESAASVAELNGVPAGTRTVTGSTALTDNYGDWVTSYSLDTTTTRLAATIQTSAPVWFGRLYTTAAKQTISAAAVAQTTTSIGGNPCVLALQGDSTGVTTGDDLSFGGNTTVTSSTCGVRSDGALTAKGSVSVTVPTVITSGSSPSKGITCTSSPPCEQSGAPQVPDPFSSTYGNELSVPSSAQAGVGSSSTTAGVTTYNPGIYSSGLSLSGNGSYVLSPGVYYVNGFSIQGNATLSGSGVTIISTGDISLSGTGTVNLTAPSMGATTAGLLFGTSTTSGTVTLTGNSGSVLNGAVYAPNANVKLTGNSDATDPKNPCFEIVAATVTFTGDSSSTFDNTGCSNLGVPTMYNSPAITQLVQ